MLIVTLPLTDAQLNTLKRDKCRVRRIGSFLYEVRNKRGKVYQVQLSYSGDKAFVYTCTGNDGPCESEKYGNTCRHATSSALVAWARNEAIKRSTVKDVVAPRKNDGPLIGSTQLSKEHRGGVRI